MNAILSNAPLRNWLLSGLLIGAVHCVWAAFDDSRWAVLTVFVVSQPDSGLVLAKSFYRIPAPLSF